MSEVLGAERAALLTAVLDCLIPPRDDLPGAGGLGLGAKFATELAAKPLLRRDFFDGLLAIDTAGGQPFAALDTAGREAAVRAVEEARPLFFAILIERAYRHYYTDPRVQRAVGMPDAPPQPLGYALPPFDESLLAIQRKREPFWRRVP